MPNSSLHRTRQTDSNHPSQSISKPGHTVSCAWPISRLKRGLRLSGNPELFACVLSSLRAEVGDIEFGYRAQGLFAQVLRRVGANVREIRHQGHPDIIADLDGRLAR